MRILSTNNPIRFNPIQHGPFRGNLKIEQWFGKDFSKICFISMSLDNQSLHSHTFKTMVRTSKKTISNF